MARVTDDITGLAKTTFALVALYLVLKNAAGGTRILTGAGNAYTKLIKTLQGR